MNPSDAKYILFQSSFIESLNSDPNDYLTNVFADLSNDREKWNFINEARKSLTENQNNNFISEKSFWRNCIRSNENSKSSKL